MLGSLLAIRKQFIFKFPARRIDILQENFLDTNTTCFLAKSSLRLLITVYKNDCPHRYAYANSSMTPSNKALGSTGGIGRSVVQTIINQQLIPLSELRISAYNKSAIPAEIVSSGIGIREGNLYKPATLEQSYSGAQVLFLVSFPSMGEERYTLHRNAIDAAKTAGVQHIIYTSLSFCGGASGSTSVAQVAQAHLKTEAYLKGSGLTYTIVRMASYAHLWNNFAGFLNLDNDPDTILEVVLPNDGVEHWANREELGEGTAHIIAKWVRKIYFTRKRLM